MAPGRGPTAPSQTRTSARKWKVYSFVASAWLRCPSVYTHNSVNTVHNTDILKYHSTCLSHRTSISERWSLTSLCLLDRDHSRIAFVSAILTMRSFYSLMGAYGDRFSIPFTTSWALGPLILAIIRLVFSLYAFLVTFITFGVQPAGAGRSFSFFTSLTYWGIAFYTLVAGTHTLIYALRGRCWLDDWPRALQALHALFYTTIITFPFLVTIVYWAILYSSPYFTQSFNQWSDV